MILTFKTRTIILISDNVSELFGQQTAAAFLFEKSIVLPIDEGQTLIWQREVAEGCYINWDIRRMSSQGTNTKPSTTQAKHSEHSTDCAVEAATLLNCVAAKNYSKEECITLLDSLRSCIKNSVSFWLITTSEFL